ncbi:hypothetical protein ACS0TY_015525 [Phlomoides rotata]
METREDFERFIVLSSSIRNKKEVKIIPKISYLERLLKMSRRKLDRVIIAPTLEIVDSINDYTIKMNDHKPNEAVPMAVFWLFSPFFLLAGLDSFLSKDVDAFYERGSPEHIRRYCPLFTFAVSGLGLMNSVICVYVVGKISEIGGREGWFQDNLNKSRLDRYYLVLAGGLDGDGPALTGILNEN